MKEGSFDNEIAGLDFDGDWENNNSTVLRDAKNSPPPTPDQLPQKLDFSHLPENLMRTGVIESLISQNDDLMARLTVSLRRIGLLEEKLNDTHTESLQYRSKYENLKDQVLILREQSRLFIERAKKAEQRGEQEEKSLFQLKEQIKILEIRYAELSNTHGEKESLLKNKYETLKKKTSRLEKYRKNIRRTIVFFKSEFKSLREKRSSYEFMLSDLKKNLSETTTYISEQAKKHKHEFHQLTQSYETQIKDLRGEIEMLNEQNRVIGERSRDAEELYNEKVKIENNLIIAQRKYEELELQTSAETSDIQRALARHRNDATHLALELKNTTEFLNEKNTEIATLKEENKNLTEQVETLQLLWREQQNTVEKFNEQKNSLQKLNQELSVTINQYRKDIRDLKEKNETIEARLKNETDKNEKILAQKLNLKPSNTVEIKREDSVTPEIISKIDKALSNLHTI